MRIFVDNCLSPVLASTLDGYVAHLGHQVAHVRRLPCGPHATDIAWMAFLEASGDEWLVLTGDLRIQRNRPERLAFKQAHLRGIVLVPGYQAFPVHQQISMLLWRWPDIEDVMRQFRPPFLFEIPTSRTGKFRALPI